MPHENYDESIGWKEYKDLLRGVGKTFAILALGAALCSAILYFLFHSRIEQISHRDLSPFWTNTLLLLPIIVQLLLFWDLHNKKRKGISDDELRAYFKFYFRRMAFSLAAYTILWLFYVVLMPFSESYSITWVLWIASKLSLLSIIVLIYIIVHATYLVTKTSFVDDELLITKKEVALRFSEICHKLKLSATEKVAIIMEGLRKDRDCKVHSATSIFQVADLDVAHLTAALNRLIYSRDFYYSIVPTRPESQTLSENLNPAALAENYNYLVEHLFNGATRRSSKSEKQQLKLRKQKEQRDGITLFPFYTLVFFFSLFLCIAYLFGFAFAFEDKSIQLATTKKHGVLFMSDDVLEDVGQKSTPKPTPTPISYTLNSLRKVFYFNSGGAGITTEIPSGSDDKRMGYIARINKRSLASLVDLLQKALLKDGESIRVQLIGRADDNTVDRIAYASNYEISTARAHSVRSLLQQELIKGKVSPKILSAIEWIESPFSNDGTLPPKQDEELDSSISHLFYNNRSAPLNISEGKVSKELIDDLDKELNLDDGNTSWTEELRGFRKRLRDLAQSNKVSLNTMREIHDSINEWNQYKKTGAAEQAEKVGDDIEANLYQFEDPLGRKRSVEVYLFSASPQKQEPLNESSPEPHLKRMALMDYLYFAVYTITTTGYGDIKPLTPYAKFLCTLANITEIFFIVVFFNTLISLKRRGDMLT